MRGCAGGTRDVTGRGLGSAGGCAGGPVRYGGRGRCTVVLACRPSSPV